MKIPSSFILINRVVKYKLWSYYDVETTPTVSALRAVNVDIKEAIYVYVHNSLTTYLLCMCTIGKQ